mmetsp:Transcript_23305/g.20190  ORF Transcript_23305/g.20190 Transcript_23305/m.20190 type:complete len:257 (+) Transcript_23305:991-1761(+)
MDTDSLNTIFPGIKKAFGEHQPCYIECGINKDSYPNITILENGIGFFLPSICSVYANNATSNQYNLAISFKTDITLAGFSYVNSTANRFYFNMTNSSLANTEIVQTNIGNIDNVFLQFKVNLALMASRLIINQFFAKNGFPLPNLPLSQFPFGLVHLRNHYLEISFNPSFMTYDPDHTDSSDTDPDSTWTWNSQANSFFYPSGEFPTFDWTSSIWTSSTWTWDEDSERSGPEMTSESSDDERVNIFQAVKNRFIRY